MVSDILWSAKSRFGIPEHPGDPISHCRHDDSFLEDQQMGDLSVDSVSFLAKFRQRSQLFDLAIELTRSAGNQNVI